MIGQVIKAQNGVYRVFCQNQTIDCTAKGTFKLTDEKVLTGDYVEIEETLITKILPRKNRLIRPNVANVDQVAIVLSSIPKPDYVLIDKLLLNAEINGLYCFILVNKAELSNTIIDEVKQNYVNTNYEIIEVSATTGLNVDLLKAKLSNKLTLLAGQSAVGKTSLVNALLSLNLRTGDVSEKIQRGRHTTTYSQIYFDNDVKIVDSPGFAVIDANVEELDFASYCPDFAPYATKCKFRGCSHVKEEGCAVIKAVSDGNISIGRYDRYVEIYNEIIQRRKR